MRRRGDQLAAYPAGLYQRHRNKHRHAHHKHHIGHLKGGEALGGIVAQPIVHRVAEHGQQQEQQAQRRDHHRPAHGDQRYAADRAQGAQHLPPGDALMQNQHVHQDAAHRHRRDDGPRHSGGGVQNAVVFEDEVRHRLHDAQQQQLSHRLSLQREGKQRLSAYLAHQSIQRDDQRHGRHRHREPEGQQHCGRRCGQRHF